MEKGGSAYPAYPAVTPVIAPTISFGDSPMQTTCGNCRQTIVTQTIFSNGAAAYVAALIICLLFFPCFWVPLCMDSCKDVHHRCPSCGAELGAFKRL